ncbi:hypothetical protein DEO72_LG6g858 [Vigna unguiculata]|uniref:Uncharacterized protein n=1 Tax=Vigna unguiculata TaxID=3917 RepID=A0A4D6M7Q9_VIGUN|nr:hypothetical protein DEO72_LG6g858 [Vigna unguiculata]
MNWLPSNTCCSTQFSGFLDDLLDGDEHPPGDASNVRSDTPVTARQLIRAVGIVCWRIVEVGKVIWIMWSIVLGVGDVMGIYLQLNLYCVLENQYYASIGVAIGSGDTYRQRKPRRLAPGGTYPLLGDLEACFTWQLKSSARRYCRAKNCVLIAVDVRGLQSFGNTSKVDLLIDCPPQYVTDEFGSLWTLRTMFVLGTPPSVMDSPYLLMFGDECVRYTKADDVGGGSGEV